MPTHTMEGQLNERTALPVQHAMTRLAGGGDLAARLTAVLAGGAGAHGPALVSDERDPALEGLPMAARERVADLVARGAGGAVVWSRGGRGRARVVVSSRLAGAPCGLDAVLVQAATLMDHLSDPHRHVQEAVRAAAAPGASRSGDLPGDLEVELSAGGFEDLLGQNDQVVIPVEPPPDGVLRWLTAAEIQFLEGFYGGSLNLARVVLCRAAGIGGRPFTLALPFPSLADPPAPLPSAKDMSSWINVIMIGKAAYDKPLSDGPTLAHEAAHCWQSQHAIDPLGYVWNSLASQGLALVRYGQDGVGAYHYVPGRKFRRYGAEQLAEQIEVHVRGLLGDAGEVSILAHMRSAAPEAVNAANVLAMTIPRYEDPADPTTRV